MVERHVFKVLGKAKGHFRKLGLDLCQRGEEGVD